MSIPAPRAWRFSTRIALPVATVAAISLALSGIGLYWSAKRADTISVDRQVREAKGVIAASVDALAAAQEPLALWDEAVEKSRPPIDETWFLANFAAYYDTIYGGAQVYILDGRDQPLYSAIDGKMVPGARFEPVRPMLRAMIDEARGRVPPPRDHPHDRLPGGPNPPREAATVGITEYMIHASHIERIDGRPAAISIMHIAAVTPGIAPAPHGRPLLVTIRFLDGLFLKQLARDHLIDSPRFSVANLPAADEASTPLVAAGGEKIGYLLWKPELPGTELVNTLGPFVALSAAITIALMGWLTALLRRVTAKLQAKEMAARHEAFHDGLTGLPNRANFNEKLDFALAAAGKGEPSALLLLDLDRFKAVNDTMGHAAGDAVLREFAKRVAKLIRPHDTVARFGGDEFGVVLMGGGVGGAESTCQRILEATRRPFGLAEGTAHIGVSIGVAMLAEAGMERTEMLRAADRALYLAKTSGRDTFTIFRADPEARGNTVAELRAAIEARAAA